VLPLHMAYAFFCPTCDVREVSAGDCPCGDGPFLDLRTQMARDLLEDIDNKRKHRRDVLHRWLAIIPTVATMVAVGVLLPWLYEDGAALGIAGGVGVGSMLLFGQVHPHRSRLKLLEEIPLEDAA
jgi:hypothetical protein